MFHKVLLIITFSFWLNATEELDYDKLFYYLESRNIVIGQDITVEELFVIINDSENKKEIDKNSLMAKINVLLNYKKTQYEKIKKDIDANPNSKINKTVKSYLNENNEFVENAQKDLKEKNEDGWFSKSINYILELMKY